MRIFKSLCVSLMNGEILLMSFRLSFGLWTSELFGQNTNSLTYQRYFLLYNRPLSSMQWQCQSKSQPLITPFTICMERFAPNRKRLMTKWSFFVLSSHLAWRNIDPSALFFSTNGNRFDTTIRLLLTLVWGSSAVVIVISGSDLCPLLLAIFELSTEFYYTNQRKTFAKISSKHSKSSNFSNIFWTFYW